MKTILGILLITSVITINGCSFKDTPVRDHPYTIKPTENIDNIYALYKTYKTHKAMAIAMDTNGYYVGGYSYDCASQESARKIALQECNNANAKASLRVESECKIYALENHVILDLKNKKPTTDTFVTR